MAAIDWSEQMAREPQGAFPETFLLEDFFVGRLRGSGCFIDVTGRVRSAFNAAIEGAWDGSVLTVAERFAYNDGKTEDRVWEIEKTGPGAYRGRTEAVIGEAPGTVRGNVFHWKYRFALPFRGRTLQVSMDDRMILTSPELVINSIRVKKFGLPLGTITIVFARDERGGDGTKRPLEALTAVAAQ